MPDSLPPTPEEIVHCYQALDEKKALSIRTLYLGSKSSITDYYIIATGNSFPHLKALSQAVREALRRDNIFLNGLENELESGWLVVDAYLFMVHLFTQEQRDYYQLETLWKDAEEVFIKPAVKVE